MNRVLLIAVIILSLSLAGVIGYTVAHHQLPQPSSSPSQQPEPKYTQQQIADMQAELREVEAALADNEKQQQETLAKLLEQKVEQTIGCVFSALNRPYYGINPQSMVDTSIQLQREYQTELQELQAQHEELFERKILLTVKLEATQ